MTVNAVTHLNFRGDARAALEFYRSVFGGDLTAFSYEDMGNVQEPSEAKQVMWGQVAAGNGFRVMAYDVPSSRPWSPGEDPFFISLRGDSAEEISTLWEGLSDGATVVVPLAPAQWAPLYGMLKDRFGVTWVVDVVSEYARFLAIHGPARGAWQGSSRFAPCRRVSAVRARPRPREAQLVPHWCLASCHRSGA